jgi:nucleotide-binding universal stress UspA family protein
MKNILVPTDFSENAENALYYAIDLAKKENAKIILLHAYQINYKNPEVPLDFVLEEEKQVIKESNNQLKTESLKIAQVGNVMYEYMSIEDSPIDGILNTIKQKEIDLVVMGTKGMSNIFDAILGSNTAKIIEKASCPVIAVPEEALFSGIKEITYATAYNQSDFYALQKVIEMAKLFDAHVNVLHISDKVNLLDEEKTKFKKFMDDINNKIKYNNISFEILEGENIEDTLEEYLQGHTTNLLIMSTHHRGFFDKIFGNSITKYMAYHSSVPLMAFHHTDKSSVMVY